MGNQKIILYHGTASIFDIPDISYSREDIDFGVGFYCTEDLEMAKMWAAHKKRSIVNVYELDLSNLNIYHFKADEEWLAFIQGNRMWDKIEDYSSYDILMGPTADDKLFTTLNRYMDGEYTAEMAIAIINIMGYNNQVVLKNKKAIQQIKYKNRILISNEEKITLKQKSSFNYKIRMKDELKILKEIRQKNELAKANKNNDRER